MKDSPGLAGAAIVYLAALLQGFALVSFPATSPMLKQMHGLTDAQYGAIFLPQVAAAVLGAMGAGALARRLGLRALLALALAANAGSQILLALSTGQQPLLPPYVLLLVGTALLGAGFGISGAPLNSYPGLLFPQRRGSALVALHTAIGIGLMAGPLAVSAFGDGWVAYPAGLAAACLLLAGAAYLRPLPSEGALPVEHADRTASTLFASPRLWGFVAIAVLYAFAEGTFANWAPIYLAESKHLSMEVAAAALSVFWGALVAGRLLVSLLLLKVSARIVWSALPCLMIAAFLLLPYAATPALGLALFALGGLACSAFFPLTVGLLSEQFPDHVSWVSSLLTAALMIGIGVGSFAVGALREVVPLETLYRLSALYPAVMLALILLGTRSRAGTIARAA
jgi:fucose permease